MHAQPWLIEIWKARTNFENRARIGIYVGFTLPFLKSKGSESHSSVLNLDGSIFVVLKLLK